MRALVGGCLVVLRRGVFVDADRHRHVGMAEPLSHRLHWYAGPEELVTAGVAPTMRRRQRQAARSSAA